MASLSRVAKATTTSKSLRATIPEDIVNDLGVKAGDVLIWTVEERKGKKIVSIEKWEK